MKLLSPIDFATRLSKGETRGLLSERADNT
jgi:hypothetical protein